MSEYWLETGAVLLLAYLYALIDCGLVYLLIKGVWLLWFIIPPWLALHWGVVSLWRTRPSVQR